LKDYTIKRALVGAISLFPSTKKTKLPIIKDILDKIITLRPYKADINVNMAFIIAFIGFLYIKEIIYLNRKVKDFSTIRALYNNIRITLDSYLMVFFIPEMEQDKQNL
jgi:hypothetical protein